MNIKSLIISSLSLLLGSTHGAGPVESDIEETISKTEVNHASDAYRSESSSTASFITRWEVTDADNITIPLVQSETYNFTFQWIEVATGDIESSGTHTSADGDFITSFDIAGKYDLHIDGSFPAMRDYPKEKLLDVLQWGAIEWSTMQSMFQDWPGTGFTAADAPNLSNVTLMLRMFQDATNFNDDLSTWDVSNVINMLSMFNRCNSFNGNISSWDVGSVVNTELMFANATSFNQDITQWNTSSLDNMQRMFFGASAFNQDIGSWDVSEAFRMDALFNNADAFNQDIGEWNVEGARIMENMFANTDAFDQSLDKWKFRSDVQLDGIFNNATGFSCENYSNTLLGWNYRHPNLTDQNLGESPTLGYGGVISGTIIQLTTRGWTIPGEGTGGGTTCGGTLKIKYWKGGIFPSNGFDWGGDAFNWEPAGIPQDGDDVVIPHRDRQPVLDITTNAIKSIEILNGAILTIKPTGNLILEDN